MRECIPRKKWKTYYNSSAIIKVESKSRKRWQAEDVNVAVEYSDIKSENSVVFSPQANYTDRAIAAGQRS
jgi:hypothetical protein